MSLTSASGILSLLDDKSPDVRGFALKKLYEHADIFWPEISEQIPKIETLYEDTNFRFNKLAALLASKVYYHLSEFRESLNYALCAEELFDVNAQSEHVETINAKCIDEYISIKQRAYCQRNASSEQSGGDFNNFSRLEQVVNRMFEKCFEHQQHKQALGIGLESHRLDMFERAIQTAADKEEMLQYAFKLAQVNSSKDFTRYTPVTPGEHGGILLARNSQPNKPSDIIKTVKPPVHKDDDVDDDDSLAEPTGLELFLFEDDKNESETMETNVNDKNTLKEEKKDGVNILKPE